MDDGTQIELLMHPTGDQFFSPFWPFAVYRAFIWTVFSVV
jgi:hypothetical protein